MTLDASTALAQVPVGLRAELLTEFAKITQNYRESRWEAQNLDGGRLCEVAYTILDGYTSGQNYPARSSKPRNFGAACKDLENRSGYPDSARITVPRVLFALYEIRNRRGVGHVGGDVNANHMDAEFVLAAAKWVVAELIRLFHNVDVSTATSVVDALVDRTLPIIWEVDGVKRVLDTDRSLKDQTLLLLYADSSPTPEKDLATYLEQDRLANYRRVLAGLHRSRMIEWNKATGLVTLAPPGRKQVEDRLLRTIALGPRVGRLPSAVNSGEAGMVAPLNGRADRYGPCHPLNHVERRHVGLLLGSAANVDLSCEPAGGPGPRKLACRRRGGK